MKMEQRSEVENIDPEEEEGRVEGRERVQREERGRGWCRGRRGRGRGRGGQGRRGRGSGGRRGGTGGQQHGK